MAEPSRLAKALEYIGGLDAAVAPKIRAVSDAIDPVNVARRAGLNLPTAEQLSIVPHFVGPGADIEGMVNDAREGNAAFGRGDLLGAFGGYGSAAAALPMMFLPGTVAGVKKGVRAATDAAKALPMDDASRMARADKMFPVDAYHGTHATDLTEFDPSTQDFGTHVGSRPTAANNRLKPPGEEAFSEGANVLPLKVRLGNSVRINDLGEWGYKDVINELERAGALKKSDADLLHDRYVESGGEYDDAALRKLLRKNGVDSLVYSNKYEHGGDSYIMLDPKDIRSRFAAFDPSKIDSKDLLASMLAAGIFGGAAYGQGGE